MVSWILFGYAAGSVPFAFLLARRAGIDVRVSGSGNVGAANVLRTTSRSLGVAVMALDVAKGLIAVLIAQSVTAGAAATAAVGAAAVVGHVYPVWLRFHGGKGVAVAAGVFTVLAPIATGVAACLFLATVWITRVVSLGSVIASITLPSIVWWSGASAPVLLAAAGVAALILFRHRANLMRLASGTERRVGEHV
ncbi:MAG TPA: glycerol-3-phosphate 1-O-acyltransferase PlsY [Vicinamibacterales bacterium]|nr:glycerol-3-phosphate 1-O-acyltransferase PlsY [Vicinamibacterales bacterium]